MTVHRFTLEKYDRSRRNRYTCPHCKHPREFTRYVDTLGLIKFPEYVGRCNRTNHCGYHYPPSNYFRDNPDMLKLLFDNDGASLPARSTVRTAIITDSEQKPSYIDPAIMLKSCSVTWYPYNNLYGYLGLILGWNVTMRVFLEYHVGTSRKWNGSSTVFWQVDIEGNVRSGKIMLYDRTSGHRVKDGFSRISWAHTELNIPDFHLSQCFFGEHLLRIYPDRTVAIVESEKTAIVASAYMGDLLWLASGGKHGCLQARLTILKNRRIILFPDSKAFNEWNLLCIRMQEQDFDISISSLLEERATDIQWNDGIDIADILLMKTLPEAIVDEFARRNPAVKTLIDTFNLEVVSDD